MKTSEISNLVQDKAQQWLDGNFDNETKKKVQDLIDDKKEELIESFYRNLEFGTGGLRGIMGVGTNRMNIYTVGMATQGLCNYLKIAYSHLSLIKVAIAFDSRNNSIVFAKKTAQIFSANGIKVFLFDKLRPVPELSFTIRHLKCQSGVVITASHNPKEYNGYKVYWEDGGQIIAPHDKNIIQEVQNIKSIDEINFNENKSLIESIGEEIDQIYTDNVKSLSLSPKLILKHKDMKIVYTPIHGSGVNLVPMSLKKFGFENIIHIPEQDISDGNFPTVNSPNPEEPEALTLAIKKAKKIDADLVIATDPDADRVGSAVKNNKGEHILLNGNQTASLLINYLCKKWSENNMLTGNEYIVKTIVTTELLSDIANKFKIEYFDVLTGFKFIADKIKNNEGKKRFIGGGEESYGYLVGEFVRDKDAVISCSMIAEMAAWAKEQNKSLFDILQEIYLEYGFYKEQLLSIVKKGKSGNEEIQKMMENFRENSPKKINNSEVILIKDYLSLNTYDLINKKEEVIHLPKSNVLQFYTQDGSKISVRPSGTEPKIKFYFSVKEKLNSKDEYDKVNKELSERIDNIVQSLKLLT